MLFKLKKTVNDLLLPETSIDIAKDNFTEAKYMFQILYAVLRKLRWHSISKDIMNRFLDAFECSIVPKETDYFDYTPLRKSMELCIRNCIDNFENNYLIETVSKVFYETTK